MNKLNPIEAFVNIIKNNQKDGMNVAEIGVFDGTTTCKYAEIVKKNNGKIYAIDWFCGNENSFGVHAFDVDNSENILKNFKNNMDKYLDITIIKKGLSSEKIPEIPDKSLDICFIDADHRYDNVYNDIMLCIPKIKDGGIICGHDCEYMDLVERYDLYPKDWKAMDYDTKYKLHWGVVRAVYDHFGYDIEIIPDPDGQRVPIWIKKL